MTRARLIILVVLAAVWLHVSAQTEANISQYYAAPTLINPAAAGQTDFVRIRGGARLQWVGIDNAPRTFMAAADMPFKLGSKRVGLGVVAGQESIGLYSSLDMGVQASYMLRKWGGVWSIGLQLGFRDQSFKGSEVYLPDGDDYHQGTDDAIPTTDIHGTAFDGRPRPVVRASQILCRAVGHAPDVAQNHHERRERLGRLGNIGERRYEFQVRRTLYFTAGCNIPVKNTLFEIMPSVLVKSDFTFTTGEIMARARYRKFLSFGLGYRWDDAVIITAAAEIKNFYIGYSYDYATSAIRSASSGSHELFVGYSLKLDMGDKNRNRHKSVRIM